MGGIFLARDDPRVNLGKVEAAFRRKGLGQPWRADVARRKLLVFGKTRGGSAQVVGDSSRGAACSGTLIYYGDAARTGLVRLARDLDRRTVAWDRLLGDYFVLFWSDNEIRGLLSPNRLYHVYADRTGCCVSSSFVAVVEGVSHRWTVSPDALLENLLTGCLFGDSTAVAQIVKVLHPSDLPPACGLEMSQPPAPEAPELRTFAEAVSCTVETLRAHFRELAPTARDSSISLGLSGGYDSRLIYALAAETGADLRVHTHSKRAPDPEMAIARELLATRGAQLTTVEVTPAEEMSPEHVARNLAEAYDSCDGQVRVNLGWVTDYRTRWYRRAVAGETRLGINGIGGELLRNHTGFVKPVRRASSWILDSVIEPGAWPMLTPAGRRLALDQLRLSVWRALRWDGDPTFISFRKAREYYWRGWVATGPSLRTNLENQESLFVSPFVDHRVAMVAMAATPHIGAGGRLQAAVLSAVAPDLARVSSNYGHRLDRVPSRTLFAAYAKGLLPAEVRRAWRSLRTARSAPEPRSRLMAVPVVLAALAALADQRLPLAMAAIRRDDWFFHRAVALGYWLTKLG